ncbi:MAG: glycosyltransferase family 1 protein [bacterium]|nr:glycosyltransferase family 1 protein [bacterium]
MDVLALRESLARLAGNHRWTWVPAMRRLWARLDGGTLDRHPTLIIADVATSDLEALLSEDETMALVADELTYLDELFVDGATDPQFAYFSPEFGISDAIPQYSGGLGILAGDHLKAASDIGLPLVGVGLFYRQGFFRQAIAGGQQAESYPTVTPESLGAEATGITVHVPLPGREVAAQVWRMSVGRTQLLLLDTDVAENSDTDRAITDRLYGGDRLHRLKQEILLGVGGTRALSAMGWNVPVYHLNEGHAGFLVLELIDRAIDGSDLSTAIDKVRKSLVFTTHTPVPAGIDRFDRKMILPYLELWATRWGVPAAALWELGADATDVKDRFNMAAFALRLASSANGVSKLHGEVSRRLFAGIGIGDDITSITNGVHARTWVSEDTQSVFDRILGAGWENGESEAWDRVDSLSDSAVASLRHIGALNLAQLVSDRTGQVLDPDALIVGFARRFATYKRSTLLFQHPERLASMLTDNNRPVHFVFAGKAHPADAAGKELLASIVEFSHSAAANGRFTFIPDYSITIAQAMYEGSDIWLNTPIRPREASGTSGEKSALNGGLNCSILDGWWAEMYDGRNGWAIATSDAPDPVLRDRDESEATLDVLDMILAEYHEDPAGFVGRIRHAWKSLGPGVTAARMINDYRRQIYMPALSRAR